MRAGLANRQACLYIVGNSKVELAAREFTTAGLDPRMESTGAAITVMGTRQLTHAPSVWESIEAISRWATREFSRGCETVRIALDMTFADELNFTAADLCDFEGQLKSRLIAASPIVGMCLYERSQATPEFLCQALRAHPTVLLNGHVFQSPFYESAAPRAKLTRPGQAQPGLFRNWNRRAATTNSCALAIERSRARGVWRPRSRTSATTFELRST